MIPSLAYGASVVFSVQRPPLGMWCCLHLVAPQKLMGDALPKWERMLCKAIIPMSVLISIAGIVCSMTALVEREKEI